MSYYNDDADATTVIAMIIVGLLIILGARFVIQSMNRADCLADAKALKVKYEYHGNWLAKDKCVYILPSGKRILSNQYREVE